MGKAAVDLPDPLQTSSGADRGRALTSTDDLLAQLAGEEIDRLLAEVEDGAAAPAAPTPAHAPSPAPVKPPAFLFDDPAPPAAPATDVPALPDEPGQQPDLARDAADLNAELDAIFGAAAAPSAALPAAAGSSQAIAPVPAPGLDADLNETSAAERAGLNAPAASAAAHAPAPAPRVAPAPMPPPARVAAPEGDTAPLPIYLKPLEWINAPLESCPQPVRDFVGKAAIITLANAAAILIYVLLFRRG